MNQVDTRRVSRVPRLFRTCPSVAVNFEEPASHNNEDTSRNDRYAYLGNASTYRVHPSTRSLEESMHVARCVRLIGTRSFRRRGKIFSRFCWMIIIEKSNG